MRRKLLHKRTKRLRKKLIKKAKEQGTMWFRMFGGAGEEGK